MLGGKNPFQHKDNSEQYDRLKSATFSFKGPAWNRVSNEAKDFITKLLKLKPEDRMKPEEVMSHDWINGKINIPTIK